MATDTVEIGSLVPERDLTPEREEWLISGLTAALPSLRLARLFALRRDMFRDADLITVATETTDGSAVGALSSRWHGLPSGTRFLHVMTQFVGDRYQHGIVFRKSWRQHFAELGDFPELIVLKTYNPIAFCALRAFTRLPSVTIYPDITADGVQDQAAAALAREVAEAVAAGCGFRPDTGVIRGAGLPPDLYPALPESSSASVNAYFAAVTRPGDRLLCMLSVPTPEAAAMILGALGVPRPRETGTDQPQRTGTDADA